jgi:hypothetical protein
MTVLTASQNAIARLIAQKPDAVFSSTDQIAVEIAALANEAAADIAAAHDWQALTTLNTFTGDSATESWPLPSDYDRMVNGTDVHSGTWIWQRYTNTGLDGWLQLKALMPAIPPGYWNILGGSMGFIPTIATGDLAQFYYIRNTWALSAAGTPKAEFDRDDDSFALKERVLTLALIWRWKQIKGMTYDEDIKNYDIALSQAMARDKGSRVIRSGRSRIAGLNTRVGCPWPLGGV